MFWWWSKQFLLDFPVQKVIFGKSTVAYPLIPSLISLSYATDDHSIVIWYAKIMKWTGTKLGALTFCLQLHKCRDYRMWKILQTEELWWPLQEKLSLDLQRKTINTQQNTETTPPRTLQSSQQTSVKQEEHSPYYLKITTSQPNLKSTCTCVKIELSRTK